MKEDDNIQVIKSYSKIFNSWELLNSEVALKTVDKSVFIYNSTGVPMGIRSFFDDTLRRNENKTIKLVYKNREYLASFQLDNLEKPRSKIIWKSDFRDLIKEILPNYYDLFASNQNIDNIDLPRIRFERYEKDTYLIDFIIPDLIASDIGSEEFQDNIEIKEGSLEGGVIDYYGKKHERNPLNRRKAIEYHGTICKICNFDFEDVYGKRGRNYIEIHHIKPLSTLNSEIVIDPRYDLIPVCANCHRIIHRDKDNVLSPDEVKCLIELNK